MANGAYIESDFRFSKRTRRLLWTGSIGLFLAGVIAVIVVFTGHSSGTTAAPAAPAAGAPTKQSGTAAPRSVTLSPAARRVLGRFILTAVARKNLAEGYALAGPGIRQGMTLKEWLTGNIAVVPYPVDNLQLAPFKIDYSRPSHALIEVAMLPRKAEIKKGVRSQIFFADLVKLHGKWYVDSWVPRGNPMLPVDPGHG